ncbi:MAG: HEAT repeat domain-containing protein [Anaerolineae bacterium]|nr:HEAT repeat domain-containing protein [Anaerolineae bacterium]
MKYLTQALKQLDRESPPDDAVRRLSNLIGDEFDQFTRTWAQLSADQRCTLVARMVEAVEADLELDFAQIFTLGLQDAEARVRASCIEGLWEVEDIRLIRPLIRLMRSDDAALVREAAATSLSRFALLAELGKLQPHLADLIWDALWQTIHDTGEDLDVRRRAIESIAYFDRRQVRSIIEQAYQHEEPRMRISAIFAMGRSADDDWSNTIIDELDSNDVEMRFEAVRACGALRLSETVGMLSRIVADPDAEVKLMAVWALGQIGGPEARRVLEICYEQGNEALQDAADEAMAEMDFMQGSLDFAMYDFDDDEDWDEDDDE